MTDLYGFERPGLDLYRLPPPDVFSNPKVQIGYGGWPQFIASGSRLYREVLTRAEYNWVCHVLTIYTNGIIHLYHAELDLWLPLTVNSEGGVGLFMHEDLPYSIVERCYKAVEQYLPQFDLRRIENGVCGSAVDLSPYPDLAAWEAHLSKNARANLKKEVKSPDVLIEHTTFKSWEGYTNHLFDNASRFVDKWGHAIDTAMWRYSNLTPRPPSMVQVEDKTSGSGVYLYYMDGGDYIFGDPILYYGPEKCKVNLYKIAHYEVTKAALIRGKKWVDFGIRYKAKTWLSPIFGQLFTLSSTNPEQCPYSVLMRMTDEAKAAGRQPAYFLQGNNDAARLAWENCQADTKVFPIMIPPLNISQWDMKADMTPFMFPLALGDSPLFRDPDVVIIDPQQATTNHYRRFEDLVGAALHSPAARKLEHNRNFARGIAAKIGIDNTPWVFSDDAETKAAPDLTAYLKEKLGGDKVVVKYNEINLIGIYTWDTIPDFKGQDGLIFERFIGSTDTEVSYSFYVDGPTVIPLMINWETNKLFTNTNKSGSTATLSKANIGRDNGPDFEGDPFGQALTEKLRNLNQHVKGVCGWIDVCFMTDENGVRRMTEFMMRMGFSNCLSVMRQLKSPLTELMREAKRGNHVYRPEWHALYSSGIDLYSVIIDAYPGFSPSMDVQAKLDNSRAALTQRFKGKAFFDLMAPALEQSATKTYVEAGDWLGCATGLAEDAEQAIYLAETAADFFMWLPQAQCRKGSLNNTIIW